MESFTVNGECGEIIEVSTSQTKSEDTKERTVVLLDLDGILVDSDNNTCVLLSPMMAHRLSAILDSYAEAASRENYKRLLNMSIRP